MLGSISWKTSNTFIKYILLPVVLILMIAAIKYRGGNINYYNSDATWHVLLTIEAYEETPISVHKFLPIVTLGDIDDKWITWGATIPDQYGNYYYTSFSPAGYVLPWLFMKIFHLPISESSLYIFNSFLFVLSGTLWMMFIKQIYGKKKYVFAIGLVALLTYALAPEVLHGMGIVYWHQSIMQVTLLIQVIAFYKMRDSKRFEILFYLMALLNPYIEWTGYVANVGFAIAEIILNRHDWKQAIKKSFLLGVITVCSFGLFTCHYLLVVEPVAFFNALKNRFMARNITTSVSLSALASGYIKSFLYLWGLLGILLLLNLIINRKIQIKHGIILLVLFFPVLENLIMKQHALSYSYDRMKLIFPLSFLICELMAQLLENVESSYIWKAAVIGLSAVGGGIKP